MCAPSDATAGSSDRLRTPVWLWSSTPTNPTEGRCLCDLFHVDTITLSRLYAVLRRRALHPQVTVLGVTGVWLAQLARNLMMDLDDAGTPFRFLIRDRDSTFTAMFDAVFNAAGVEVIKTSVRAPRANAIAEQLVGSVRPEVLDRILIINQHHAATVLSEYETHFKIRIATPPPGLSRSVTCTPRTTRS